MHDPSSATDTAFTPPCPPWQTWLPYQKAGIEYALARPATLIADPPGLGKTAQALGVINADDTIQSVLIVCPAYLKKHWLKSFDDWDTSGMSADMVTINKERFKDEEGKTKYRSVNYFPSTEVVVINYDLLPRHYHSIQARKWDLLIVDEAHYLASPTAVRTKHVLGYKKGRKPDWIMPIQARRRLFLTGTPITARPIDFWPLVRTLDPNGLGADYIRYVRRYCAARDNGFGLDVSGASNLEELQQIVRKRFMVRRDKREVLKDLPDKQRKIVPLPKAGLEKLTAEEQDAFTRLLEAFERNLGRMPEAEEEWRWGSLSEAIADKFGRLSSMDYGEAVRELGEDSAVAFEQMSRAREELARAKAKMVIEYVSDLIDQGEKVVLFCVHKAVANTLFNAFLKQGVLLTGAVNADKRQGRVDLFQNDPSIRVLVGNIQAAGTGFTMTAASHVVFAEFSWLPSDMEQAEDRLWRIGQKNNVTVHHLVVEDSLDAKMVRVLIERQAMLEKALDKRALLQT